MSAKLSPHLVDIAKAEIGVEEIDGTNCGVRVNEFKSATNLPPHEAWPWCAAFVCWVVKQALAISGVKQTPTFKRPTTAGAWDLENWSLRQDNSTQTRKRPGSDIKPGDIVIFTFSHVGIAASEPDSDGYLVTYEGNTDKAGSREGGGVFQKLRHISKVRSRIRFMV